MTMLADWYFCSAIRLAPAPTHAFLDILAALRGSDPELAVEALAQLEHVETSQLLYALPDVLRARAAFPHHEGVRVAAAARLADAGHEASWDAPIDDRLRALAASARQRRDPAGVRTTRPYLDTADFAAEVLVLASLLDLVLTHPDAVDRAVADPALWTLLVDAGAGEYGRLCRVLACRVLVLVDPARVLDRLRSTRHGFAAVEPDLAALVALAAFAGNGSADYAALAAEANHHELLKSFQAEEAKPDTRVFDVLATLGVRKVQPARAAAVVWAATLAGAAAAAPDPADRAWLRSWLAAPAPGDGARFAVRRPWVAPRAGTSFLRKNYEVFPRVDDDRLLAVLAGGVLAVALAEGDADPDPESDVFAEFVLHAADVLSDSRYREEVQDLYKDKVLMPPPGSRLTPPLAGLAVHARAAAERLGTGRLAAVAPERLVVLVVRQAETADVATEAGKLYYSAAALLVANWVNEAVSGRTESSGTDLANRWFTAHAGQIPPALSFLRWLVQRILNQARTDKFALATANQPSLLLKQLWPDEDVPETARWTSRVGANKKHKIGALELLTSKQVEAADWERHTAALAEQATEKGAPLVVATERLAALFAVTPPPWGGPEATPREWLAEWVRGMDAVHRPFMFRRELRRRLVQLFNLPARDIAEEAALRAILEKVVHAIVEFSFDAPNDFWSLARALSTTSPGGAGPETVQHLRAVFLDIAAALGSGPGRRRRVRSPYASLHDRRSQEVRTEAVRAFLLRTADTPFRTALPAGTTLGDVQRTLFDEAALRPAPLSVEQGDPPADERRVAAVSVDHGNQAVHYELVVGGTDAAADLFAASAAERAAHLRAGGRVSGVVCAVDDPGADPRQVWVNCGLAEPVAGVASFRGFVVGEPVVVALGPDGVARSLEPVGPPAPAPGEVRVAVVGARAGGGELLGLTIEDGLGRAVPHGYDVVPPGAREKWLRAWDPDTSAAYRPADEVRTLARWSSGDGCWLPVERGFTELVADLRGGQAARRDPGPGGGAVGDGRRVGADGVPATVSSRTAEGWVLSTSPGIAYFVADGDWRPSDLARVEQSGPVAGLRVRIAVVEDGGRASLALVGDVDRRNLDWAGVFADDRASLEAVVDRDAGRWVLPVQTAPDGFPAVLAVDGLDGVVGMTRCAFTVGEWNARHHRTGRVKAMQEPVHTIPDYENPDADRFRRLMSPRDGDLFTVDWVMGDAPRYDTWRAMTTDGLVVEVLAESISMAPLTGGRDERSRAEKRDVVVVGGWPWRKLDRRRAQPLQTWELFRHVEPGTQGDMDEIQGTPGICVAKPRGNKDGQYTLWLRVNGKPQVCTAPGRAFAVLPALAGDPVWATRGHDGRWVLEAQPRVVQVEALWREGAGRPGRDDHYLGTVERDGETVEVYERGRGRRALLVFAQAGGRRTRRHLDGQVVGRVRDTPEVAVRHNRVEVTTGGGRVHGSTYPVGKYVDQRVDSVAVSGEPVRLRDGSTGWRLRRHFTLRPVSRSAARKSDSDEHAAAWREYQAADDKHRIGVMRGADRVRLHDLHVPVPGGGWSSEVPLDAAQVCWVTQDYNRDDMRVVLVARDGGWHASHTGAVPLTVAEFAAHVESRGASVSAAHSALRVELRYAGRVAGSPPAHRFEWGYGWRLEVPENRLTVMGKPVAGKFPLFFGEIVRRAGFVPGKDGALTLDLPEFSVEHEDVSPVRQLYVEASEERIVHRLEVEVSLARSSVRVLTVHGRQRRYSDGDTDDSQALRVDRAELDPETAQWLLDQAKAEAGDSAEPRRYQLLARLDHRKLAEHLGGRVVFERAVGLRRGERLFMVAGEVVDRGRNDLYLELTLPPGLDRWSTRPPVARVYKRNFAVRESTLRNLRRTPAALQGNVMLVEVLSDSRAGDKFWRSATSLRLSRRLSHLHNYIRHHGGRCYAVLVSAGKAAFGLEFRPGVYFAVPAGKVRRQGRVPERSIVRLALDGDQIQVFCAVQDDNDYVTPAGRPVVVLPKQLLLHDGVDAAEANGTRVFTIGGLPGVEATAGGPELDGAALMRFRHPKVALAVRDGKEVVLRRAAAERHPVGSVRFDLAARVPRIRPNARNSAEIPTTWSRLTFADEGALSLVQRWAERRWMLHDRLTGQWVEDGDGRVKVRIDMLAKQRRDEVSLESGPLMFAEGHVLRYPEAQLRGFGFSAGEAVGALSGELGRVPADYAVAAPVRGGAGGLWIEVFPGRVLELPADLLVAGATEGHRPLRDLDWTRFGPGDRVRLSLHQPDNVNVQVACVALHSWFPGPRAAFGPHRTLLPAKGDSVEMKIRLGHGDNRFDYPAVPAQLPKNSGPKAVWLFPDNTVAPATGAPVAGDTVLIGLDRERAGLRVLGLDGWTATTGGGDDAWPGSTWLRDALAGDKRAHVIDLAGGSLVVTVEDVGDRVVVVSQRHQPHGRPRPGRWLRGRVRGALDGEHVLLRVGASLLQAPARAVVPGAPPAAVPALVARLVGDRRPQWFHADADGRLVAGLPAVSGTREVRVQLEDVVADADRVTGLLCRQVDTGGPRWLPADRLGWAGDIGEAELRGLVEVKRGQQVTCAVLPDGTLSVPAARDGAQRLSALRLGDELRVVPLVERTPLAGSGVRRYLAAINQSDTLVEFASPAPVLRMGEPLIVEVSALVPGSHLTVVERGTRRSAIDLPAAVVAAVAGDALLRDPVDQLVIDAVGDEHGRFALTTWLDARVDAAVGLTDACVDAGALVAAALVAAELGDQRDDGDAGNADLGPLSVWLAWQAGVRATRSRHVEPIVATWVRDRARLDRGEWQRLAKITPQLASTVSQHEADLIADVCRGVLSRSRVRPSPDLDFAAWGLLTAVGRYAPAPAYAETAALAVLAPLGRALVPPRDLETAQPHLLAPQRDILKMALNDLATHPLPLLPPAWPHPTTRTPHAKRMAQVR
ncbi:hypothetical protein [Actinokineospora sp. NPDC004072]